jgi:MFS family permease
MASSAAETTETPGRNPAPGGHISQLKPPAPGDHSMHRESQAAAVAANGDGHGGDDAMAQRTAAELELALAELQRQVHEKTKVGETSGMFDLITRRDETSVALRRARRAEPAKPAAQPGISPEDASPPPVRWRGVFGVMLILFWFYVGSSSTFSPAVLLLRELACERLGIEQGDTCAQSAEAESAAASWGTVFSFTSGGVGMIVAPLYPMATDRFGRKPLLALVPAINAVQGLLVQLVLGPLPDRALGIDRIWWYYAAASLGALSGGVFPFINCAFAAVADLTKDQVAAKRASVFGIVQISIFVGLTVGPILGGVIAERVGVRLSLIFSASCSALAVPCTLLLFRETLEPARRTPWDWKRANPFGSLWLLLQSRVTLLLGLIMLFQLFASVGIGTLSTLYLQTTFGWGAATLGYSQTVTYAANATGLMLLLPLLQTYLGTKAVLLLSCLSGTIYPIAVGLVGCVPFERCALEEAQRNQWQIWLVLSLGVLNAIYFPGIRTSICGLAGASNYGKALGAVACTQQLVSVFAGPTFFYLQGRTSEGCTGRGCFLTELRAISYMFAGGLSLLSFLAAAALPTNEMRRLDSGSSTSSSSSVGSEAAADERQRRRSSVNAVDAAAVLPTVRQSEPAAAAGLIGDRAGGDSRDGASAASLTQSLLPPPGAQ